MPALRRLTCLFLLAPLLALAQPAAPVNRAALTVTAASPRNVEWPELLTANGSIAAWQDASVGTEIGGLRLVEVAVNVGDRVRRGQVLARMQRDTVEAELAQARANLTEAEASLTEARANADRARKIENSGAFSAQQVDRYLTGEATAAARVEVMKAALKAATLRQAQTEIRAPDDGTISARSATLGAVLQAGEELFRLIRQDRLEWRAEVPATALTRLHPGQQAQVFVAGSEAPIPARLRVIGPTVDAQTRNALVYADLGARGEARPGMFARGEIALGTTRVLALPQGAVLLRDGFAYVFQLDDAQRVTQRKVTLGRRVGDEVAILEGLAANVRVVATGVAFLADGDQVRLAPAAAR
ncbi:MAG: efflux transporter periplasmic adaptor subunit [Candidatus Dactylopiibacterium carminicum]|uniref:Efflux RND transporter periplasmic adaptor subunit n=1 Tax=Candidatus Dactylopiibacterium carminicum TaxID=857335 RepID=A0A272ETA1_9RHOO|nr:efflux RND transporter periplasmic adaptor subunit [Candidatus Dactylopiibacterium carminicum]KAF7599304.1 efflux RND transporter periplasmic adaptor subunit [Candidatus Dactylopiibacterium carminicum]PAS93325.1 MAG: efflux transporter periplasmic adaptor subunit [Candidatus Dactylopiibacterium carminicum]PAS99309.1 MAG: efflux transporter periplasmic adaptor subunit [Candidatus Dactylopiibacterium carminicum]